MSLSLVLMCPNWVMHRFCNFAVETQSLYCGTNTHEAALGGLETWMTSEQSTVPQPGGMLQQESEWTPETQWLGVFFST